MALALPHDIPKSTPNPNDSPLARAARAALGRFHPGDTTNGP